MWARFEQLLAELKNGHFSKAPDSEPPGIPILRISAVRPLSVDLNEPRFLREEMTSKIENYLLENGDLLFTRYNGNLHYVGVCGVVRNLKEPMLYPDKLIRARVVSKNINPAYLEIYFASTFARRYIEFRAKSTAGQHGIAGGQILDSPVMLPPLAEQHRIVAEVERRLSVITTLEQTLTTNLARAERLRQSILHRAFTGQLV
ncbi:MAG: restriction endonuclease subunit S [Candidatus Promineifilaceae bacterium]